MDQHDIDIRALQSVQEHLTHAETLLDEIELIRLRLEESTEIERYMRLPTWQRGWQNVQTARMALQSSRKQIEELLAWSDQIRERPETIGDSINHLIGLREELQSRLTSTNQAAISFYESLRPLVMGFYLDTELRTQTWDETWPIHFESAAQIVQRQASDGKDQRIDDFDIRLAQLRWELDWSQQRIADVVGLSQPSIAARLSRVEDWISERLAVDMLTVMATDEGFSVFERYQRTRNKRDPSLGILLSRGEDSIDLDVFVPRSAVLSDIETSRIIDMVARSALRNEPPPNQRSLDLGVFRGFAFYFRDRESLALYALEDIIDYVSRSRITVRRLLDRLPDRIRPATSIGELIDRSRRKEGHM